MNRIWRWLTSWLAGTTKTIQTRNRTIEIVRQNGMILRLLVNGHRVDPTTSEGRKIMEEALRMERDIEQADPYRRHFWRF